MVTAQELGYDPKTVAVFEGRFVDQMLRLVNAGCEPKTTADFMDDRHAAMGAPHQRAIWFNYVDTGDGVLGTPDQVIFDRKSPLLLRVDGETELSAGGIARPQGYTGNIKEVARRDVGLIGKRLNESDALKHQGWFILAGENQDRLNTYVADTFKLVKDEYGEDNAMAFYVGTDGMMRAVVLDWLYVRSGAGGGYWYLDDLTRLVGVRRQGASEASAELESAAGGAQISTGTIGNLEAIVRQFGITDPAELEKALRLYQAAKELDI